MSDARRLRTISPVNLLHRHADMATTRRQGDDVKDMVIAGCRVHLAFHQEGGGWWVKGTIRCGLEEKGDQYAFRTSLCATREAAEQSALSRVGEHLGNNVDRNTSRVTNRR